MTHKKNYKSPLIKKNQVSWLTLEYDNFFIAATIYCPMHHRLKINSRSENGLKKLTAKGKDRLHPCNNST